MKKDTNNTEQITPTKSDEEKFLAELQPTDLIISELKNEFGDPSKFKNKTQLGKAITAVAKHRKDVEKIRRDGVGKIMKMKKAFNDEASRLKALILEIEQPLIDAKEKIIRDEKAAKEAEEQKAVKRFTARTDALFAVGFTYDGANYTVGTILASPQDIDQMEDADFQNLVSRGKAMKEKLDEMMALVEAEMNAAATQSGPGQKDESPDPDNDGNAHSDSVIVVYPETANVHPDSAVQVDDDGITTVEFEDENIQPIPGTQTDDGKSVDLPFTVDVPNNINEIPGQTEIGHPDDQIISNAGDFRPPGYLLGWNAFREELLKWLGENPKVKRTELVDYINKLSI